MLKWLNKLIDFEPYQLNELEQKDYETLADYYNRINVFQIVMYNAIKKNDVDKVKNEFNEYLKIGKYIQGVKPATILSHGYKALINLYIGYTEYINAYLRFADTFLIHLPMLRIDFENESSKHLSKIQNSYLEFRKQMAEFFHLIPSIVFDVNAFNMISETKGDDTVKFFYNNGISKSEWFLNNGTLNGVTKTYYNSGKLQAEWNFENGMLNGISKMYHESGRLLCEFNYKNGKPDGIVKKYHENGEYAYIRTYSNGELIKKRAYDDKGKLEFQEDYQPTIGNREDDI